MSTEIASFGTLFRTAWEQYKQRALPILAVILISTVLLGGLCVIIVLCATLGGAMLVHVTDEQTAAYLIIVPICVLLLAVTVLAFWCQTALLALIVDEKLGIIESFQTGWTLLWPMGWLLTIASGILLTGLVLGVLPGILFLIWFSFCGFILLEEDHRGLDALLASREYVRGYWWNTFGKLLALWLISAVLGVIPFIGQIFSLLFTPFLLLFMLAMYRNLKSEKGVVTVAAGQGSRIFWWSLAVIGLLVPLAALLVTILSLLTGEHQWVPYTKSLHSNWL